MTRPACILLTEARARGFDVFVLPRGVQRGLLGDAWLDGERKCINVYRRGRGPMFSYVLAHEIAHHDSGDTAVFFPHPMWATEYYADMAAMDALREHYPPGIMRRVEELAKRNVRNHMRGMDVPREIAEWAGARCPELVDVAAYLEANPPAPCECDGVCDACLPL